MKDLSKHTRLHRRPGSRNYYFRAKVPVDLQDLYGKKEIYFSLKTSDQRTALERLRLESVKLDQEFAEKRRQRDAKPLERLSVIEIERITALWFHECLKDDEQERFRGISDEQYDTLDEVFTIAESDAREALAACDLKAIANDLNYLLESIGMKLDPSSEAYEQLSFALLKTKIKVLQALEQRHAGNYIDTPPAPFLAHNPTVLDSSTCKDNPTITQIHAMWGEEHKAAGGPEKTVKDFGVYVRRFVELHGDLPVSQITKTHIRDYKDAMLHYPARPSGKLRDMSVTQALEYVKQHPETRVLSSRTVNDRALGAVGAVLGWAEENAFIESNPAAKIKVKAAKVSKTVRLPYSVDDLNTIFRFPIYTKGERPKAGGGEAAKWLPLLAAFTGARLEELGQLTVDDIKEDQGIKLFDMTSLEEGKRRKTESSKRRVPIHSKLIECGFLDYVEQIRQQGQKRLFPDLKSSDEKLTAAWSKWWGRYARQQGGFDKLKVFHSFRHAFKDGLREGGVQEEISDAITGHAPQTEGRKYGGHAYPLKPLKEGIERLLYPGLDLSLLS